MLQKREAFQGLGDLNTPGLHAAGAQRQGSETPSCSRPATKRLRGRGMTRFFLSCRQSWATSDAQITRAIPRPQPSIHLEARRIPQGQQPVREENCARRLASLRPARAKAGPKESVRLISIFEIAVVATSASARLREPRAPWRRARDAQAPSRRRLRDRAACRRSRNPCRHI
jgi:hypothetical protein